MWVVCYHVCSRICCWPVLCTLWSLFGCVCLLATFPAISSAVSLQMNSNFCTNFKAVVWQQWKQPKCKLSHERAD